MAQTSVHGLSLAISGLIPFKNAFKKAMAYIDNALPAPFVVGDIGKVAKVVTDGAGGAKTAWAASNVQASFYKNAAPGASEVLLRYVTVEPWSLPANLAGSKINIGTNASATAALDVKKNNVSVGGISISTGGVGTLTTVSGLPVSFVVGDVLDVVAQASADSTLAKIAVTLLGPKA